MAKMVRMECQVNIKTDGKGFYETYKDRPYLISTMSPNLVQGVDLCKGNWGKVGSIVCGKYSQDGKQFRVKYVIEAIDDEKKSITFKVIEGDILKMYKSFVFINQVDTVGNNKFVKWTMEFEKLNEDVVDPVNMLDFLMDVTKDIDTHLCK